MSLQQKRIDDLVKRLRDNGLRMTPQRQVVLKAIISNNNHPNVDEIYNHIHADYPMIGRATIYKTIAMLKEMGEITELFFNNEGARYEVSGGSPHPHFICNQCNCVIDIEDDDLAHISAMTARNTGYNIMSYRLDFFGLCPDCQAEKNKNNHNKEKKC
jgi:Fur family peroxide stress response transcriptional regulator